MKLDTPICDFGWKAPDFTLKDAEDKSYSLCESLGKEGLLIAIICNHCPYVQRVANRLAADTAQLMSEGINVLAIMSNDYTNYEADSPANMKLFAQTHGFKFPYLVDEDQSVGKAYGAVCTPDFFGFNAKAELQYRGRLDDVGMSAAGVRVPELLKAMRQIAKTGIGPAEQAPSMGCSIKWRQ